MAGLYCFVMERNAFWPVVQYGLKMLENLRKSA